MIQIKEISNVLLSESFFPAPHNIFRFAKTPIKDIKCVFLGMEPYASWYTVPSTYDNCEFIIPEATGRSFEVNSVTEWNQKFKQTSLRNILKSLYYMDTRKDESLDAIREKIDSREFPISQPHDWFDEMEKQGVVFLNATLTVKKDSPDSHRHLWDDFMTDLISYMNKQNPDIIWILAGDKAQNRALSLVNRSVICPHPRIARFVKSCPFEAVETVNWIK